MMKSEYGFLKELLGIERNGEWVQIIVLKLGCREYLSILFVGVYKKVFGYLQEFNVGKLLKFVFKIFVVEMVFLVVESGVIKKCQQKLLL